jgi:hypothetical protein
LEQKQKNNYLEGGMGRDTGKKTRAVFFADLPENKNQGEQ